MDKDPIRAAEASDAERINEIYEPYVRSTGFTFEVTPPTADEMRKRIHEYSQLGWLVYERDERVLGYAYASSHRARAAYQWCCEVSVYVDECAHREGIAHSLYQRLFAQLRKKGLVNAYAGVTLPNDPSVHFHERMGFRPVGVYHKIGFKLGQWRDVGWWELQLQPHPDSPEPPTLLS